MANKVYSGVWHNTIANLGNVVIDFNLRSVGREIKIKSITFNLIVYNAGMTVRYDWRTLKSQVLLQLGNWGTNQITYPFTEATGAPTYIGNQIEIYEPGQLLFDGFFITNALPIRLAFVNFEGDFREFHATLVFETEEKTLFAE